MITSLLIALIDVLKWAFVVYFFVSLLMPSSRLCYVLRSYADIILQPFRVFLRVLFPASQSWPIDFSPILLFAALQVLVWLLALLGKLI